METARDWFELLPAAAIEWSPTGSVARWNAAAQRLLGYTEREALGLLWADLVPDGPMPDAEQAVQRLTRRRDGALLPLQWSGASAGQAALTLCHDVGLEARAFEQCPLALMVTDNSGTIESVNQSFVEMTGYSRSEVLGRQANLLKSGLHSDAYYADLWTTVRRGEAFRSEICNRRKSGEFYWESMVVAPVRDARQETIGFVAAKEDISRRKEFEKQSHRSEDRFKSVFETMQDGYLQLSVYPAEIMLNSAAVRLLGYGSADELLAVAPVELFQSTGEYHRLMGALFEHGSVQNHRARLRRRSGERCILEGNLVLKRNPQGQPESIEAIFRDVTERVIADEERQGRLAAESANRLKTEFLANMSHEIRTPLNAIIGLTHLARHSDSLRKHEEYLAHIDSAGQALLGIVNDILDLSKIEAGKLELELVPFSLDQLLHDAVTLTTERSEAKGLRLALRTAPELPQNLLGDPLRLSQILLNLLNNAVKFTSAGEVALSVEAIALGDEEVRLRFRVSDTGIGISPDDARHLFQAFSQADSLISRRHGGTGLGLAICKRLVGLMDGTIGARSEPGQGSVFTFTARFGRLADTPTTLPDLSRIQALVLDPEPTSRQWLVGCLREFGMVAAEADTVESATLQAAEGSFQVLFVDYALIGRAELLHGLGPKPIWVVGHTQPDAPENSLASPFTRSDLLDCLLSALGDDRRPAPLRRLRRADCQGERVLVVEDNAINQLIAREILEQAGLQVEVVQDGAEAIARVHSLPPQHYGLVLMDLQMPVMDGLTATRGIRANELYAALPIVAMTAHVLAEEREHCRAAGMNDYVSKPIEPETLFRVLGHWIAVSRDGRPATQEAQFPRIEGLDSAAGLRRVGGNVDLYRRLLAQFTRQHQTLSEQLTGPSPRAALHAARGILGNLGFSALHDWAEQLEREPEQLGLARFVDELERTVVRLAPVLPEPSADGECAGREGLLQALERLRQDLESSSGSALQSLEEAVRRMPSGLKPEAAELVRRVENYDFPAALQRLADLHARV